MVVTNLSHSMGGTFLSSYRIHHSIKLLYPALLTHTSTRT